MWESSWKEVVYQLGDAIQHGSKWSCKEAHNGSSSQELFFPFGKDVSIRQVLAGSQCPGVLFAELFLDVGDGVRDELDRAVLQLFEDQGVSKGGCKAPVVQDGAIYP